MKKKRIDIYFSGLTVLLTSLIVFCVGCDVGTYACISVNLKDIKPEDSSKAEMFKEYLLEQDVLSEKYCLVQVPDNPPPFVDSDSHVILYYQEDSVACVQGWLSFAVLEKEENVILIDIRGLGPGPFPRNRKITLQFYQDFYDKLSQEYGENNIKKWSILDD